MLSPDILLVEDEAVDAKFFQRSVKKSSPDVSVLWKSNGKDAVAYIEDCLSQALPLPSIVVLDIKLPGMRGFDILQKLRAIEATKTLPVIMFSSSTQRSDIEQAYHLGANSYLSKPPNFAQLGHLVNHVVEYWIKLNKRVHNTH